MKEYLEINIRKLDTGYYISSKNEEHGIESTEDAIIKIKYILGMTPTEQSNVPVINKKPYVEPTAATKQRYGIITELIKNSKWPINKSDFLVPELISIPNNKIVVYGETIDGRVCIQYRTSKVYTTFEEIDNMLSKTNPGSELLHVQGGMFSSNQRTCIRQFMISVREGLKPGDSVELDPDKKYRKMLNGSSIPKYERGTLESVGDGD